MSDVNINTIGGSTPEFGNKQHIEYVRANQRPAKVTIEMPKWLKQNIYSTAKGKDMGAQKMLLELLVKIYGTQDTDPRQSKIE